MSKNEWITLAKATAPLLGGYMEIHKNNADSEMISSELGSLIVAENWIKLLERFQQLYHWLPDESSIHIRPFSALCDLCSESEAIYD